MALTVTEGRHPTEMILSEANGQRSRAGAVILAGASAIRVGEIIRKVAGTTDVVENWVKITTGSTAAGIALYAAPADASNNQSIAILVRDCEVNGNLLQWPSGMSAQDIAQGKAALAALGIIVRD